MNVGALLQIEKLETFSCWELDTPLNGYQNSLGNSLVTQVEKGRNFQIIELPKMISHISLQSLRMKVRLLEDGYLCWLQIEQVLKNAYFIDSWNPNLLSKEQILSRIPHVIQWIEKASEIPNKYLWGGTTGPNYDCSGLIQSAFSSQGIWLPRDAYQQEQFSTKIDYSLDQYESLLPGDLFFFGTKTKCNHVGIHISEGRYWHSSGISHGLNGIGINSLHQKDSVSSYYRSIFRSIGRVDRCHDGTTLL